MSELNVEPGPMRPPQRRESGLVVAAIAAAAFIALACITACTVVAIVFIFNAPWR